MELTGGDIKVSELDGDGSWDRPWVPIDKWNPATTEQQLKCLRGEHEAMMNVDESQWTMTISEITHWCKHCRCLYVEKA